MATILVIDDDPAVHDILEIQLKHAGYAVAHAPNGAEGIAQARSLRPDLILLDFEMPGETGDEVFTRLRAHEAMGEIPVVFLSSLKLATQVGRVPISRNVRFLKKPIEVKDLLTTLREFLG